MFSMERTANEKINPVSVKRAYDYKNTLTLTSFNRDPTTNPANDSVFTGAKITNVSHFMLEYFNMSSEIYNINDYNYRISVNGTVYTVVQGFYNTFANLVSAINTGIAASGLVLSYSALTRKMTFTLVGAINITTDNPNYGDTLLSMLGFPNTKRIITTNAITAPLAPRLNYTAYIDVGSFAIAKFSHVRSSGVIASNLICRIPTSHIIAGDGVKIEYQNPNNIKLPFTRNEELTSIDIFLIDSFGNGLISFIGDYTLSLVLITEVDTERIFNLS